MNGNILPSTEYAIRYNNPYKQNIRSTCTHFACRITRRISTRLTMETTTSWVLHMHSEDRPLHITHCGMVWYSLSPFSRCTFPIRANRQAGRPREARRHHAIFAFIHSFLGLVLPTHPTLLLFSLCYYGRLVNA